MPPRTTRALVPIALALSLLPGVASAAGIEGWREVMPAAERIGPVEGEPPAAAAHAGGEVVGYVFSTQDATDARGYSGKPLDITVGLNADGTIAGAELVEQHEPIGATGRTARDLEAFVAAYAGRSVAEPLEVVDGAEGDDEVEAISGATVTSLVLNQTILEASRAVAASRGIFESPSGGADLNGFEPLGWAGLLETGWVALAAYRVGDVESRLAEQGGELMPPGEPDDLFLEAAVGLASAPTVGRNLLEPEDWRAVAAGYGVGDSVLFIAARGRWSLKGTAWRRSGVFERVRVAQDDSTYALTSGGYARIEDLAPDDAPEFREAGLFVLPATSGFEPGRPWRLQVLAEGRGEGGETVSVTVEIPYAPPGSEAEAAAAAGEPAEALWRGVWERRWFDLAILATALTVLTAALFVQDRLVASRRLHARFRVGFLLFTLVFLGWHASAQLSVVNVLTFANALLTEFRWDFFLLEPMIFVLWAYVAAALLFWGRGVFCGWLCPFGALQELLNAAARRARVPQLDIPFVVHERLRPIKFLIFLGLFALSLGSMERAIVAAEVEPFKTAIILNFVREWPFVLYAVAILAAGLFVSRFYCRYVCPLGAALALPARLRQFEWLRRYRQCGQPCQICATNCPVGAIQPRGDIHPGECIHCLACQVNYKDDQVCPVMIERRNRRAKLQGKIERAGARAATATR